MARRLSPPQFGRVETAILVDSGAQLFGELTLEPTCLQAQNNESLALRAFRTVGRMGVVEVRDVQT
jgi:hypothetical protein